MAAPMEVCSQGHEGSFILRLMCTLCPTHACADPVLIIGCCPSSHGREPFWVLTLGHWVTEHMLA